MSIHNVRKKKLRGLVEYCTFHLTKIYFFSILQIKGPFWPVPLGRRDGRVSIANEALTSLPSPFANITQLKTNFASKGLNTKDLVVLSGTNCHLFALVIWYSQFIIFKIYYLNI